jgi:type I restriction enzyme, R subunit
MASANEFAFQNDMINQFVANGWLLGTHKKYNREPHFIQQP